METLSLLRTPLPGSRQVNNIFWAFIVSIGGLGFFLAGLVSFFKFKPIFFSSWTNLSFIPQGIILMFYGTIGLILGIFLWLTIWWDVGFGYNEYNKSSQLVTIYRKGFPGKYEHISVKVSFNELKSIKMLIRDGLNPQRQLFLCLTDNREIPLLRNDKPIDLTQLETEALKLSRYLNLYLETE